MLRQHSGDLPSWTHYTSSAMKSTGGITVLPESAATRELFGRNSSEPEPVGREPLGLGSKAEMGRGLSSQELESD